MLSLPDRIKEEVLRRRKTASVADELLPLDSSSREELASLITELNVTSRTEVRKLASHWKVKPRSRKESADPPKYYEQEVLRERLIDRTLAKCMASLKESMGRFDEAMSNLSNEDVKSWVILESLMWHRRLMNAQVDDLLRLRKRFRSAS